MKKVWRITALVLMLTFLCTSLCGCQLLDEFKANHAIYVDDDTILWGDVEYKRLPGSLMVTSGYETDVYVTEEDVPVLLCTLFGDCYSVYYDGLILEYGYSFSTDFSELTTETFYADAYEWETAYYCRVDEYDKIAENMQKDLAGTLEYDTYSYTVYEYDESTGWYQNRVRILTDAQVAVVEKTLASAQPVTDGIYDWQMEYLATIEVTTADRMFFSGESYDVYRFTVSTEGTMYYLYDYLTEGYYIVAEEDFTVFEDMMTPAVEAMEEEYVWDYF